MSRHGIVDPEKLGKHMQLNEIQTLTKYHTWTNNRLMRRAEIGQYLAAFQRSPGDMDLIKYLSTQTS